MKKALSIILSLCMVLALAPVTAFAKGVEPITNVDIINMNDELYAGKKVEFTAGVTGDAADAMEIYEEVWLPSSGYLRSFDYDEVIGVYDDDFVYISSRDKNAPTPIKGTDYQYGIAFTLNDGYVLSVDEDEDIDVAVTINGCEVEGSWHHSSASFEEFSIAKVDDTESEEVPEDIYYFTPYNRATTYGRSDFRVKAVDEYIRTVGSTNAPVPLYEGAAPKLNGKAISSLSGKAVLDEEALMWFEGEPWWKSEESFVASIKELEEEQDSSSSSGYKMVSSDAEYNAELEEEGGLLTTIEAGETYYYGMQFAISDMDTYNFSNNLKVTVNGKTYSGDDVFYYTVNDVVIDWDEDLDFEEQERVNICMVFVKITAEKNTNKKNGWVKSGDKWYYYENGTEAKGWKKVDGKWYYLDPSTGAMKQWYQTIGGKKYYFNSKGEMVTGWVKFNATGKWHYYKADGSEATGWFKDGSDWYYANAAGEMQNNMWIKKGGKWYYLTNSGKMAVNMSIIYKGKSYKFDKNGVCLNP